MLSEEEVAALVKGRLELDSLHTEVSSRAGEPRMLLAGVARIDQRERRGFGLSLFVREDADDPTMVELFRAFGRPGTRVLDEELLKLSFLDSKGRLWACDHFLPPGQERNYGQPGAIWHGQLGYLTLNAEHFSSPCGSLRVFYPGMITIPLNQHIKESREVGGTLARTSMSLGAWVAEDDDFAVQLVAREGHVEATLAGKRDSLPPGSEARLTEALQFVLARPLEWGIAERYDGSAHSCQLRAVDVRPPNQVFPPIGRFQFDDSGDVGRLLLAYLRHVIVVPGPNWHPLSADIRRILLAAGSSLEVLSLELGIAIESLLARDFADVARPDPTTVQQASVAAAAVLELPGIDAIRERALAFIRSLSSVRAADRLWALAETGVVRESDISAWKRLRHSAAHGAVDREFEAQRELVFTVYSLLMRLVFQVIGYAGRFTEYGESGWPERQFPEDR